jgi:D-alanyl-D-alanine carboxypeptidase (penicillin-binding protein 5/6)
MRQLAVLALAFAAPAANAAPAPAPAPVPGDIPVALLVDLSTGQTLFARQAERRFVPASVTKVMTAYTAFKLVSEGKLRLDMPYLYSRSMQEEWYGEGSNMFLLAGERPTVAQLLLGVTTVSGNDASEALAMAALGSRARWLALMNANARALGLDDTHFGSPHGYPDGGSTYTTARDLAVLGRALTQDYPGLYRRFFGHRQLTWRDIRQQNHDPLTGQVDGGDGIKTGFTAEAGFTFLGSAERDRRRLLVVLAAAPSGKLRDDAARALIEWGFAEYTPRRLLRAGAEVGMALVQDGEAGAVPLRVARDVRVALPQAGAPGRVRMAIRYRGPVRAPVAAGAPIARLELTIDGQHALDVPLEATQAVAQAGFFTRIGNGLAGWFG